MEFRAQICVATLLNNGVYSPLWKLAVLKVDKAFWPLAEAGAALPVRRTGRSEWESCVI